MSKLRILTLITLLCVHGSAHADLDIHPGDSLREALGRFAGGGLNIIYSGRLIPTSLLVIETPAPGMTLQEQVTALLSPHQLRLVMTSPVNGYVSRADQVTEYPAQDPKQGARRDNLVEEITVSAPYRVQRHLSQAIALPREDLQTLPSLGRDTLRNLDALPGVASSGVSARQRFRGGDDNEVLYRLDGVTLIEPFHLGDVQSLFSAVNPNIVDSVNVYLSGFPVSSGTKMSGVVDLQTIEASDAFDGTLDLNPVATSVNALGNVGRWDWLVSTRHSLLDLILQEVETDYGEPRFSDQLVRLHWEGDRQQLTFGLMRSEDRLELRNPDIGETGSGGERYETAWLDWQSQYSPALSGGWRMTYAQTESKREGELENATFASGEIADRRRFTRLQLHNDWQWSVTVGFELDAGWSIAWEEGQFTSKLSTEYGALALPIQAQPGIEREIDLTREGESASVYLSASGALNDRLMITAGVRYDAQDMDPVHVSELSARIRLRFGQLETGQWFVDAGRYTQQQQLHEVQTDDGKVELDAPQHADQLNLGFLWQPSPAFGLRTEAFVRKIDNPWSRYDNLYNRWVLLPELQGDRYLLAPSRALLKGFEVSAQGQFSRAWSWNLSYALNHAEEKMQGSWIDRPWQERNALKLGLRWHNSRWQIGLRGVYHGGWPVTDFISEQAQLPRQVYADRLPSYLSFDAHIGRRFLSTRGQLEIYLDVTNLSDHDNVGGYNYLTETLRDDDSLLPLIPLLGISWHW